MGVYNIICSFDELLYSFFDEYFMVAKICQICEITGR